MRNMLSGNAAQSGAVACGPGLRRFSVVLATTLAIAAAAPSSLHAQIVTNTFTSLSLSPNPAATNQIVTANVVVSAVNERRSAGPQPSGSLPSGAVAISGGGQSCTAALAAGVGSCTLSFPTPGIYTITANYPGDASYSASSASQDLTVNGSPGASAASVPTLSNGMLALLGMALAALAFFVSRKPLR